LRRPGDWTDVGLPTARWSVYFPGDDGTERPQVPGTFLGDFDTLDPSR